MKIIKVILKIIAIILIIIAIPSTYYTFKYMHLLTKSKGYTEIYTKKEYYDFNPAPLNLSNSKDWKEIDSDIENDGDIPNSSDVKKVYQLQLNDTLWFKYDLYNNIDINNPMVSLALDIDNDPNNGMEWYGTIKDFNYDLIIAAGYVREGLKYKGYNFIDKKIGFCKLHYILETNSFLLGIPLSQMKEFENSRFVASVGNRGLWNDDSESINILKWN